MYKINIFSKSFSPDINLFFKEKVNLYIDYLSQTNKNEKNILWLCEPDIISNIKKDLNLYANEYDYILTFDEEVLQIYKNSVLHLQASTWVENNFFKHKEFSVSMVIGNKIMSKGHLLRQKIWHKQNYIKIPKKFYISCFGSPLETFGKPYLENGKKDCMFYSQFHITVENCSIKNYFSEKILDCFISKTIPIYWGCSNIEDFFNIKGIIKFNSFEDFIEKCNNINELNYLEILKYLFDFLESILFFNIIL